MNIKNPERLLKKYLKLFGNCINSKRLLSEEEIVTKIHMSKTLFEQKYLPKLRDLALIIIIPKEPNNVKLIKTFKKEGVNIGRAKTRYYFFTPQTAKIIIFLNNFVIKFNSYIKDKEKILSKINKLIILLGRYEMQSTISKWSSDADIKMKKDHEKFMKKRKKHVASQKQIRVLSGDNLRNIVRLLLSDLFLKNPVPNLVTIKMRMEIGLLLEELIILLDQDINMLNILETDLGRFKFE